MIHICWFKKDLRLNDHAPLTNAIATGEPVIPLYILEPDLWQQPDMSERHYLFLSESLSALNVELTKKGQGLVVRVGKAVDVFKKLREEFRDLTLWSHQETGNGWTYKRDLEVSDWAKKNGISWHEATQNGVIRKLTTRDGWSSKWYAQMASDIIPPPEKITSVEIQTDLLPSALTLGLRPDGCTHRQKGGRQNGLALLHSFLHERGEFYMQEMSSPLTAQESCSRLSPHLAFGTVSIKEVFHAKKKRETEITARPRGEKGGWSKSLWSFAGRLRWHCHFIQKLEDEPRLEFENLHPSYDSLRQKIENQDHFLAWKEGKTGFPFLDACMRNLIATGWINFRMRAMLMSFASYHLWLPWQETSLYLARLFTDYEPGIHYSQAQMQSGTTGINAIRIYSPLKQSLDQDPEGLFIRQWIPELKHIDDEYIHTPWESPTPPSTYPKPIIDEAIARKTAASKIYPLRKTEEHKEVAKNILAKHGSRKKPTKRTPSKTSPKDS